MASPKGVPFDTDSATCISIVAVAAALDARSLAASDSRYRAATHEGCVTQGGPLV